MRRPAALLWAAAALVACDLHTLAFVPATPRHHRTTSSSLTRPLRRIPPVVGPAYTTTGSMRLAAAPVDGEAVSTAVTVAASGAAAASPFVAKIVNNLSSVAVLAVIIAVHELGHFLAGALRRKCVSNV